VRAVLRLCIVYPGICLTTEANARVYNAKSGHGPLGRWPLFIQISAGQFAVLLDGWWAWPAASVPVCWGTKGSFSQQYRDRMSERALCCDGKRCWVLERGAETGVRERGR
jgi:hypothetical protein